MLCVGENIVCDHLSCANNCEIIRLCHFLVLCILYFLDLTLALNVSLLFDIASKPDFWEQSGQQGTQIITTIKCVRMDP